jgi:chromate transporter
MAAPARPGLGEQARTWFAISVQSIGGGASTLFLMRRSLVMQQRWISESAFTDDWAISRISPGLTILSFTALLGGRIDGRRGTLVALLAMVFPAGLITLLLTIGFGAIRDAPLVTSAIEGMGPAALGLAAGIVARLASTVVRRGRAAIADAALFVGAGLVAWLNPNIPLVIIAAGAVIGTLLLGNAVPPAAPEAVPESTEAV